MVVRYQVTDLSGVPPQITSTNSFSGTVGVVFSNTVTASGSTPITFSASNLPAGLTNSSNGLITGTPTIAGTNTVTLTASNAFGWTTQSATFAIQRAPITIWVATNGNDSTGTGSQASPYATLQKAIDGSQHGDTVMVRAGTYRGTGNRNINLQGKRITVRSEWGPQQTILDLERNQAFNAMAGETLDTVLDGLQIINGYLSIGFSGYDWNGAGIITIGNGASLTIRNCIFANNETVGTYSTNNTGIIVKQETGGTPLVTNCLFYNNRCGGGGITGAYVVGTTGGSASPKYIEFNFCTFYGNTITAGGYRHVVMSAGRVNNSIFWSNSPSNTVIMSTNLWANAGTNPVTYSLNSSWGSLGGTGLITNAPLFVDAANGNFLPATNSPAVNAGDPASPLDPDGTRADIGYRPDRFTAPSGAIPPFFSTSYSFSGTVGVVFSNSVMAGGTVPITFIASNLPAGLTNSTNGLITGTPTIAGTNITTITASNAAGSVSQAVTFVIAKGT
ncbi:MAG: DUF1565 domain-containing protein, partial [Proteobacteria bacterium]|nr:DUF1565 domain-containing protein [Pseudomonadota bacterium]NBS80055.1 DUF1565 domain-containing protein [bacterium]